MASNVPTDPPSASAGIDAGMADRPHAARMPHRELIV